MIQKPYVIIADPSGKSWKFAKAVYEEISKKTDNFSLNEMSVKRFRDGEFKIKVKDNVRRRECYFIHDSCQDPANWFTQLAMVGHTLLSSDADRLRLVFPYLRFARQDNKDESRVPVTTKIVGDLCDLYSDGVLTLDTHNPAIRNAYDVPFDDLQSFPIVIEYLRENHPEILEDCIIMSTDAGGAKRAKSFAKKLGIKDLVVGYKNREKAGEVESLKILGDVKDKKVIIIDDIIDSGNTLGKAGDAARQAGAKEVYAYCTHALFTEGIDNVASHFDKIFISDTIDNALHPKIEIISLAPLFAEAIYRISHGLSLSALFEVK